MKNSGFNRWICYGAVASFALAVLPSKSAIAGEKLTAKAKTADAKKLSPLATQGPEPAQITPPSQQEIRQTIEQGIDYLLESQRKSGAWGSAATTRYYQITAPVPGAHQAFRAAVTGLAVQALIESENVFQGERQKQITLIEATRDA